jgi:predicted Zn-dependent protease
MTDRHSLPLAPAVLAPDTLRTIARQILELATADTMRVTISHMATSTARVTRRGTRINRGDDELWLYLGAQFGRRAGASIRINQIDRDSLHDVVRYLERVAREQPGDATIRALPIPARRYRQNTSWCENTATALGQDKSAILAQLLEPVQMAHFTGAAFVGIMARSTVIASTQGIEIAGQDTDAELSATGWTADAKGMGRVGQAARDWTRLDPERVAQETVRRTQWAANPVAVEPGRKLVILDRPAVAQLVQTMGHAFDSTGTLAGYTPLWDRTRRQPKLGQQIMDARLTLSSDPADPEGGYLPFNGAGYPLVPMTWVERGVAKNLAYNTSSAASRGITPANDPPESLRLTTEEGTSTSTIDEMIASCPEGIFINRFAAIQSLDPVSGLTTGVTDGGCYLIKDGKIAKSVKSFRFLDSPWLFLNRVEAIGESMRAALGYAPWIGNWPLAPIIVPPLTIRDFNLSGLADTV